MSLFNSLLADQLSKLQNKPQNFKPRPQSQHPRCMGCNRYLVSCTCIKAAPPAPKTIKVGRKQSR